jgi:hypothetical protein
MLDFPFDSKMTFFKLKKSGSKCNLRIKTVISFFKATLNLDLFLLPLFPLHNLSSA